MKVLTDTGNFRYNADTNVLEVLAWPNTREHEQQWGIDDATG